MMMWPTFMVVDKQSGNIEITNIWKMASQRVLYVSKCYGQHIVVPIIRHEVLSCPSCYELYF
jgi:hypothetical protein